MNDDGWEIVDRAVRQRSMFGLSCPNCDQPLTAAPVSTDKEGRDNAYALTCPSGHEHVVEMSV
ncbi:hypothetical protein BMS3Bbin02_00855 [bacterium BMS3Bbin02]|nr:hypothetical protein BMS3Bbin02_00855 [bacterium BMS3Bbin02]